MRQGCVLFSHIFNIYSEHIICEALESLTGDTSMGGRRTSHLQYVDDTTLIVLDEEEIEELINLMR